MAVAALEAQRDGSAAWSGCTRGSWRSPTRKYATGDGARTTTPGWPHPMRPPASPFPSTAAIGSAAGGNSAPAPTTATGSSSARCSVTAMAASPTRRPCCTCSSPQRLPDRRGLLECRRAEGDWLQGHHRARRLRAVLPGDERRPGDRRHRTEGSRCHRIAVQDAVVEHVPARHHLRGDRHLRGGAGRPPRLPARASGRTGTAIKDDPYVLFAISEAAADINAARQELLANVDKMWDIVDLGVRCHSRSGPWVGAPRSGPRGGR